MYRLGSMYLDGVGVAKNSATALKWIRPAAEAGHAYAQVDMGNAYYWGIGVSKDPRAAFAWYLRAAQAGFLFGQLFVATMYDLGDGVTQDHAQAVKWYREAAGQDFPGAMAQLGVHLKMGRGVAQNEAKGVQWLRKAAERRHVGAQNALALGYRNARDYRQAAYWFAQAAGQGSGFAKLHLGLLYEEVRSANLEGSPAFGLRGDPRHELQVLSAASVDMRVTSILVVGLVAPDTTAINFAAALTLVDKFLLRYRSKAGPDVTLEFTTFGVKDHLPRIAGACGWDSARAIREAH